MTAAGSNNIVTYRNLAVHSFSRGASSVLPDATAFSASGNSASGYADYRLEGATTVSAAIYSHAGTFVSQDPENPSGYMLGVFRENMDYLSSQGVSQALYCAATGSVYTYAGGLKQMYTDMSAYLFGQVITQPLGELVGYGVNFYFSFDGVNYTRAAAVQTGLQFNAAASYCYETYSAAVPASVKFVRVEINDVSSVPVSGGGAYPKDKARSTALASVTISGGSLVMGEPEIAVSVPVSEPPASSAESEVYYGGERAASKPGSSAGGTETYAAAGDFDSGEKGKSSSSKFEGTITSSSKTERKPSSKQETESEAKSRESSEPPRESASPREEAVVYEVSRGSGEKSTADTLLTGFIILVSGAILLYLITMGNRK